MQTKDFVLAYLSDEFGIKYSYEKLLKEIDVCVRELNMTFKYDEWLMIFGEKLEDERIKRYGV